MSEQILILFFIAATLINLSLAAYGWAHRQIPGAAAFAVAMLFFAILPLMQALNEYSPDISWKVIALKSRVESAGIGATAWLLMILQLTGYRHLVKRRLILAMCVAPTVFMLLNWTENPLFRSNYYLDANGHLGWSTVHSSGWAWLTLCPCSSRPSICFGNPTGAHPRCHSTRHLRSVFRLPSR